jgi:hypothetical protein
MSPTIISHSVAINGFSSSPVLLEKSAFFYFSIALLMISPIEGNTLLMAFKIPST